MIDNSAAGAIVSSSPLMYSEEKLQERGFRAIEVFRGRIPSPALMLRTAKAENLAPDEIVAFRTGEGEWMISALREAKGPYVEKPMMR